MSGIRQLQEAEQEAMELIKKAKHEKAQLMQVAKQRANAELDLYRRENEAKLAEKRSGQDDSKFQDDLEKQSGDLTRAQEATFKKVAPSVINYLVDQVMLVSVEIPQARKKNMM